MSTTVTTTPVVSPESLARVGQGVAAETGHGGLVEAHPVVTGNPVGAMTFEPAKPAAPAPAQPSAPAPAPAVNVTVNTPAQPGGAG